jgi:hypothetical protein
MHVERYGNIEVQGIELGTCHIFPKLDGTNASVWIDGEDNCAGSRNRQLTLKKDNAGFYAKVKDHVLLNKMLRTEPSLRPYGEWLVPHNIKTYNEDAWRKFYIFDIWNDEMERYLHYDEYQPMLEIYGLAYIPPLAVLKNANYTDLLDWVERNDYLIQDGKGVGEGIVIKNYDYVNKFGDMIYAKIVKEQPKAKDNKRLATPMKAMVEQEIVDTYITKEFIEKEFAKIVNEMEGWTSKYIARLLSTVFYELVNEEMWNIIKKMKNPIINFKTLNIITIMKIKELKPSIF